MPNLIPDIDVLGLVPWQAMPTIPAPDTRRSVTLLLNLLDSRVRHGVMEDEFHRLFVRCDCGYVFTRRAANHHACAWERIELAKNEVIDLTGEE